MMDEHKQDWWDEAAAQLRQRLATEVVERPALPTEDELAEQQARRQREEELVAARRAADEAYERERPERFNAVAALARETVGRAAAAHPVLGVLAGKHMPHGGDRYNDAWCTGCPSDYEYGEQAWPCDVWTTIANSL